MGSRWLPALMVAALVPAFGCSNTPSGPLPLGERPAQLEFYGDGPRIQAPTEALVGQTIEIIVQTFGGGCIEPGRTELEMTGPRIRILPFDMFPPSDAICTADLRFIDHIVTVKLTEAGLHTLAVTGVRVSAGAQGMPRIEPVTFESEVTVRAEG